MFRLKIPIFLAILLSFFINSNCLYNQVQTELVHSLYSGSEKSDEVNGMAVDSSGNIYVLMTTNSTSGLTTSGCYQLVYGGGESDALLSKYSSDWTLIWSTYIGGTGHEKAYSVKCNLKGEAVVCGWTSSAAGIAFGNALQKNLLGTTDGFIACFDKAGKPVWITYIGGNKLDEARDIDLDSKGNIAVCGSTNSDDFPSEGSCQSNLAGESDGFILKMASDGKLIWSSYIGGSGIDSCKGISFNSDGYIAIAGLTDSKSFNCTQIAQLDTNRNSTDGFVAQFTKDGNPVWYNYYGGTKLDYINDVSCDSKQNIFLTGHTQSSFGISTDSALQATLGFKFGAAFISKFDFNGTFKWGTYIAGSQKFDYGNSITCDSSDSFIMVGTSNSSTAFFPNNSNKLYSQGLLEVFAVKFSEAYTNIFATWFGGTDNDYGNCVTTDKNNNIYFGGKTSSSDSISSVNNLKTAPDGFFGELTGIGNVMLPIIIKDTSIYPVNLRLYTEDSPDNWVKRLDRIVLDSKQTIVYDARKNENSYKLILEPVAKRIYYPSSFDITRSALLRLRSLSPGFVRNNFNLDTNSKSSIALVYSNNGILGSYDNPIGNVNKEGIFWPRGTLRSYIFGGGIWFAAVKKMPNSDVLGKYCVMSHNPNNGNSWMVPGRFEENKTFDTILNNKYKSVRSTNYNPSTGENTLNPGEATWPIWKDASSNDDKKYGKYIFDPKNRKASNYPYGPSMFSDENIFSTFNDLNVDYYDYGGAARKEYGYPLGLQFEQNLYTWESGVMKDALVISYKIINISKDTLLDCWVSPEVDYDIGDLTKNTVAANDRGRYYVEDDTLSLGVGWSNTDSGELGKGFGYLGFSFLQTPAVDAANYLRKDKPIYAKKEQIGMRSMRFWVISDDPSNETYLYDKISSGFKDGDTGPGDKRILLATGPFKMLPNDTAKVVFLINFANPAKGGDADGTTQDMALLVQKKKDADKFWQDYYTDVADQKNYYDISSLEDPYPNPVRGKLNLQFSMEAPAMISLDITNIFGESVMTIINNKLSDQGVNLVNADLSSLADGQYFIRLKSGNQNKIKKIVIIK